MKIYTKTGDKGETSLFGGAKVSKDNARIEAYGTIDELNAFLGLLCDHLPDDALQSQLRGIQNQLFNIGSNLAIDPTKKIELPCVSEEDIIQLEKAIDLWDTELEPLTNFILPGGHTTVSYAHVCRTVCRRAERRIVTLQTIANVNPLIIKYVNRLSDYFFTLSRYLAKKSSAAEILWSNN
jgi:cob(I)alamin adenosyltransferase